MRNLLSIFVLFLTATASIAQSPAKTENWRTFTPAWEEFSVETPIALDQQGNNSPNVSRKFSGMMNGAYVFVFSDPLTNQAGTGPRYFQMVRDAIEQISKSGDSISADGSIEQSISFKDKFGYFHNVKTLHTANRTYIAQTVSLDEKSEIASRFIKSFSANLNPQPDPQSREATGPRIVRIEGNGSGLGPIPVPPPAAAITTNLKILSKPRPGYTDLARIYGVQGTIVLLVEFLQTGQIGSVKAMSELPFGLTQTAITAAKSVSFEPAAADGSPVTVTKRIEYSYSIY